MKEDASGRRQRAVMATDAEWERIGRAAAASGMDLSRFVFHRALDRDPLPPEVLRRAVREMLVLSMLECYSAAAFDPSELGRINALLRRSASNTCAEQHLMGRDEWEDAGQGWSGCEAELHPAAERFPTWNCDQPRKRQIEYRPREYFLEAIPLILWNNRIDS